MTPELSPNFNDGKAPDALRTIGEVAKAFNLRQHVLRYWEEQFPMLRPLTRAGARRYYRPEDVALVARISSLLYQEGFTIRGARQALMAENNASGLSSAKRVVGTAKSKTDTGADNTIPPVVQSIARPEQIFVELQSLRETLLSALDL